MGTFLGEHILLSTTSQEILLRVSHLPIKGPLIHGFSVTTKEMPIIANSNSYWIVFLLDAPLAMNSDTPEICSRVLQRCVKRHPWS
jgi:hypothetical protein